MMPGSKSMRRLAFLPTIKGPIGLNEALQLVDRICQPPTDLQRVPLVKAHGRILGKQLVALTDLPPFDRAAVDGFAVRRSDLNSSTTTNLRLVGDASAGHPFAGSVRRGEAIRILTGAPVANGADIVVMQETCTRTDRNVIVSPEVQHGDNIRKRGEDCRVGRVVLEPGSRLTAGDIALAAGLGYRDILVFPRPRVALFSTGDELCEAGAEGRDGQIADANRPLLGAMLESYGCDVTDHGILPDSADAIVAALVDAAAFHDLIVTSGGI